MFVELEDAVKHSPALLTTDIETLTAEEWGICKEFARKNHNLYIDNFCNSFPLMLTLKHNGFLACGTAIEKFKLIKRGEYAWKQTDDGIIAFRWKDKKCVNFLSNYHNIIQRMK